MKIYFNNVKDLCLRNKISKFFTCALDKKIKRLKIGEDFSFEVSLRYVSQEEIKNLNLQFRNIEKVTDVLSFPIVDFNNSSEIKQIFKKISKNKDFLRKSIMLGDIVVCKDIAKKQAKEYKHSLKRELCFLILHGFLHLLGYDHIETDDEKEMLAEANRILIKYGVKR